MAARRIKRTSPTSRTTSRAKNHADTSAATGAGYTNDHEDPDDHDHEHSHGMGTEATVPVELHAHLTSTTDAELSGPLAVYLFDEEERALCHCQVLSDHGKADVPRSVLGQMVTVAVAPVAAGRKEPILDILRAREVPILRVIHDPAAAPHVHAPALERARWRGAAAAGLLHAVHPGRLRRPVGGEVPFT